MTATDASEASQDAADPDEGTIRFAYGLQPPAGPIAPAVLRAELRAWRGILRRLALLGQQPERYGGFGFGNLSARDPDRPSEFIVTASQTSGLSDIGDDDLVRITHCRPARFWVDALGHQPPSSETLTHAALYRADPGLHWVLHGHCPEIWARAESLALPCTPVDVEYGTPQMAAAMAALLERHPARPLVFVTLGHADGVFACGASARDAGTALVALLARALT